MDLREIDTAGFRPLDHWYYRTKRIPVGRCFSRIAGHPPFDVIDIGAGSGVFSDDLANRFGTMIGNITRVDLNYDVESSIDDARIAGLLRQQRDVPPVIEHSLVLLMDVLEHVPDDRGFLERVVGSCRGVNHVFISVPAFQSLWSGHDEFLGHYRRYTLRTLRAVAGAAGVRVTRAYYLFGLIFPAVWAVRRLRRRRPPQSDLSHMNTWMNEILAAIGGCDAAVCRFNRLFGVTAVLEGEISR